MSFSTCPDALRNNSWRLHQLKVCIALKRWPDVYMQPNHYCSHQTVHHVHLLCGMLTSEAHFFMHNDHLLVPACAYLSSLLGIETLVVSAVHMYRPQGASTSKKNKVAGWRMSLICQEESPRSYINLGRAVSFQRSLQHGPSPGGTTIPTGHTFSGRMRPIASWLLSTSPTCCLCMTGSQRSAHILSPGLTCDCCMMNCLCTQMLTGLM